MAVHRDQIQAGTHSRIDVVNVTSLVAGSLEACRIRDGLLCVSVRHTTCALALNEDEAGLRKDLERVAGTLLDPVRKATPFRHDRIDHNAQAHLTACILGPSLTVPVEGGAMVLGTWQSVMLVEMDGPRTRRIDLTVVG